MPHIYRCLITLMEATFFSSREVSDYYQTEPFIGNYALAYALGLCQAPYFNDGRILYAEHLGQLNDRGIYVTPGTLVGEPRFSLAQFNATADAHWYAFSNNVIVTRPDDSWTVKQGPVWYVVRSGQRQKVGLENRPQHGRIRFLALGNQAVCYVISEEPLRLPSYIRLGKFMSKARVEVSDVHSEEVDSEGVSVPFLLNPADLPPTLRLRVFDLLNVPPTPLVQHALLEGRFYRLKPPHVQVYLPVGMRFGVKGL